MAKWKKVVVSGSSAELAGLTLDKALTGSSGGTGLAGSDLTAGTAGQVLTLNSDKSGFELTSAAAGDVTSITTPTNGGLNITDNSDTDGNVSITMSINDLGLEAEILAVDALAFHDLSATGAVKTRKVTFGTLSGSILDSIAGEVNVTAAGVSTLSDTITGSIIDKITGDVDVDAAGASVIQDNKITFAMLKDATTGSILDKITGDVDVSTTGVSTIATSLGALGTNEFTGSFTGSFTGDGSGLTGVGSTLTIDADGASSADVDLVDDDLQIFGTSNEIETIVAKVNNDVTVTLGLPDDVTIGQDLNVTRNLKVDGNLDVAGTASFTHAQNLAIADKYILLSSGSSGAGDGGFVVEQGTDGIGELYGFDSAQGRWGITSSFNADTSADFSPSAFMSAVVEGGSGVDTPSLVATEYVKKGNIFVGANEDIYIYS